MPIWQLTWQSVKTGSRRTLQTFVASCIAFQSSSQCNVDHLEWLGGQISTCAPVLSTWSINLWDFFFPVGPRDDSKWKDHFKGEGCRRSASLVVWDRFRVTGRQRWKVVTTDPGMFLWWQIWGKLWCDGMKVNGMRRVRYLWYFYKVATFFQKTQIIKLEPVSLRNRVSQQIIQ